MALKLEFDFHRCNFFSTFFSLLPLLFSFSLPYCLSLSLVLPSSPPSISLSSLIFFSYSLLIDSSHSNCIYSIDNGCFGTQSQNAIDWFSHRSDFESYSTLVLPSLGASHFSHFIAGEVFLLYHYNKNIFHSISSNVICMCSPFRSNLKLLNQVLV